MSPRGDQIDVTAMSFLAKTYIATVCAAGAAVWIAAISQSGISHYTIFLLCLIGACASSGMKIHLPSIKGTLSVNFLVILLGVSELTFLESLIVGCSAVLWQYIWKAKERRELIKIGFNLASSAVAISFSVGVYTAAQRVRGRAGATGGAWWRDNCLLHCQHCADCNRYRANRTKKRICRLARLLFLVISLLPGRCSPGGSSVEPQRDDWLANMAIDSSVGVCGLPDVSPICGKARDGASPSGVEIPVSGQHEPRDSNSYERSHRHEHAIARNPA